MSLQQSLFPNKKLQKQKYIVNYIAFQSTSVMGKKTNIYEFEIVETKEQFDQKNTIYRRYSQFAWFRQMLVNDFLGYVVPSLPKKVVQFDVDQRIVGLVEFIEKIINNPEFMKSQATEAFLKDQNIEQFIELHPLEKPLINRITNQLSGMISGWYNYFTSDKKLSFVPRQQDDSDRDYESIKISLGKELVEMEKFIRAAGEISSNFNSKTRALEEMKKNFGNSPQKKKIIEECTGKNELDQFNSILREHKIQNKKIKEKVLYRLEMCYIDIKEAESSIQNRVDIKENLYKLKQTLENYKSQSDKEQIQSQIDKLSKDYEKINSLLKDNIKLFCVATKDRIDNILINFDQFMNDFQKNIAKLEPKQLQV